MLKIADEGWFPKIYLETTNGLGRIWSHDLVDRFLRSEEVTFVYNAFDSMDEAKRWINRFAGGENDDYSFIAWLRP